MSSDIWLPVADKKDSKTLRQFGLGMSLLLLLIFMCLLPWLTATRPPLWPALVSSILLLFALVWPRGLYYPYRAWMMVASILNAVNTRIIMFIAFFGMIVPIGLVLRLIGKVPYQRKPQRHVASYWKKRERPPAAHNLKEPF